MTTYDYTNQAWIRDGRYIRCGHPETMDCGCYGRAHAGEYAAPIHIADEAPPIAAEADAEYRTRIAAAQVSWQFTDALRPRKAQASIEDLPLFGGERQEEMFLTDLSHRRISPKELRTHGWTAQPKGPGAGRDYHHQDGWQITHCGHPTAHWPYILTSPDGDMILTGAAFGNPPTYGTAWPTVAAAVDYVATRKPLAL